MNRDYTDTLIYTAPEDIIGLGNIQKVYDDVNQKRREQTQADLLKRDPSALKRDLEAIAEQETASQNPQLFPPSD